MSPTMQTYTDYQTAYDAAVELARLTNQNVAIRSVKEYGKAVYAIKFASRNDSDYDRAEIVKPTDPRVERRTK
jgi:hypothetical protein